MSRGGATLYVTKASANCGSWFVNFTEICENKKIVDKNKRAITEI